MSEPSDPLGETRMTLGEHLEELRSRLIKGVAAITIGFVVAWVFQARVTDLVVRPHERAMDMLERHYVEEAQALLAADPSRPRTDFFESDDPHDMRLAGFDRRLQATGPSETFFFTLKVCLYFAVFLGAPVLLWQMWGFVGAGLYRDERRAILRYFPISLVLFLAGIVFGYLFMVPYAMYYLNASAPLTLVRPDIKVDSFLGFLSTLSLACGLTFQLPVLMTFLGAMGIVEPSAMARYRGHFLIGAFVLAAVITPPDPVTQVMLGLPMVLLYELGIWSARVAARRRGVAAAPSARSAARGSGP